MRTKISISLSALLLSLTSFSSTTNVVHSFASPENYMILMSSRKSDSSRTSLQRQIVENLIREDEKTEEGRMKWHGHRIRQIVDLDQKTSTVVYSDGYSFKVDLRKESISRETGKNCLTSSRTDPKGVPRALASARARRKDEKDVGTVTVVSEVRPANTGRRPE